MRLPRKIPGLGCGNIDQKAQKSPSVWKGFESVGSLKKLYIAAGIT
jgi:hypothetical protein